MAQPERTRPSWTPPAVEFLGAIRRRRDRPAAVLCALILAYALSSVVCALDPNTARFFMGRFHLRTQSFAAWALFQPGPWMYNFDNRYWASRRPLSRAELDDPPPDVLMRQVNHQSARAFTFADNRPRLLRDAGLHYFYLESRYRSATVLTAYVVDVEGGSATAPRSATVRRLGASDD